MNGPDTETKSSLDLTDVPVKNGRITQPGLPQSMRRDNDELILVFSFMCSGNMVQRLLRLKTFDQIDFFFVGKFA